MQILQVFKLDSMKTQDFNKGLKFHGAKVQLMRKCPILQFAG
ncbi:hypothetical protein SynROS8604_03523 [Synechococcus sp. ROS8604]|nr:hypothetical protein SynROS8604_03523 [Synechococcus sp. ROS8604]